MKQLINIIVLLISLNLNAQTPTWQWINVGGSNLNPTANGIFQRTKQIGTDANGNIYGIAPTNGDINIDSLQQLGSFGYDDFVVFSYTCDGQFRWIQRFGSYTYDLPGGIIVQPNGDVYVSGGVMVNYWGDSHFADSIIPATNSMWKGYFICKLNSSGHLVYLNLPGPPNANVGAEPIRMEADNQGNPVVLTWFSDSTTWNGHHVNGRGHYLVKFNKTDGSLMDIVELNFKFNNGVINYRFMEFTIDTDNSVFLYSSVPDTVFINGDTLVRDNNMGILSNLIAHFNMNGGVLWHREIKGYWGTDSSQSIKGKPQIENQILFMEANSQSYSNSKFLGIPINNPIASAPHKRTKVFASFDKTTGNIINAINIKSANNIDNAPIGIQSNVLIAAGPSAGGLIILNSNDTLKPNYTGSLNMGYPFIVSMDTGLTHFNWGIATKTLQANSGLTPSCLHVDHNNNILVGGGLTGPITNTAGDTTNLVGFAENFCIAKVAFTNDSCACAASVPTLSVVSSSGNTLTIRGDATNQPDSLYVFWGDGDSTLYANAGSNINHTFASNGPWNVCLRAYGFCGVEDSCLSNLYSGIQQNTLNQPSFIVYPNPFNNKLNIELSSPVSKGQLFIYDLTGREIFASAINRKHTAVNTANFVKGVYLIKLCDANGCHIKKLVKD